MRTLLGDNKSRPNHDRYIAILRSMTPEQRLLKSFELTAFSRDLLKAGLRQRHPELNEESLQHLFVEQLKASYKQHDRVFADFGQCIENS